MTRQRIKWQVDPSGLQVSVYAKTKDNRVKKVLDVAKVYDKSDAQLIAAAPEMLAALKEVHETYLKQTAIWATIPKRVAAVIEMAETQR